MKHRLIHGDCLKVLSDLPKVACIFADPPDNLGLPYCKEIAKEHNLEIKK